MHPEAPSLADKIAAIDPDSTSLRDGQASLIASLTDQLAAGQSETLYSLHTAGANLRRQAKTLQSAIDALPGELAPGLKAQFAELARETTVAAASAIDTAAGALSDRFSAWEGAVERMIDAHKTIMGEGTTRLSAAGEVLIAQTTEAVEQIASAAQDVGDQLKEQTRELGVRAESFAADAKASADAVTAVGENVIVRLIEVLDARDKADKALEDRLNARIDRLTKRAETTVNRLMGALADETDLLRAQAQEDRASQAQQLAELVDRLLAQPRGKLKDLRSDATKETKA